MEDVNNVQALECISSEVGESQFKIILSSQCIKAQVFLVNKLRKQSEQRKEACNYINNGNLKLETEVKIAQQKIKSSITALETIKSANIELKKELLLSKERKSEIFERIQTGIAKYENMWEVSKRKYENIPFIRNFLATKNQSLTLRENINALNQEAQNFFIAINKKRNLLLNLDRELIIKLADYLINQRPQNILMLKEKTTNVVELNKEIQGLIKNHNNTPPAPKKHVDKKLTDVPKSDSVENSWINFNKNDMLMLPKLQLCDYDLDALTNKLDQIKKDDFLNPISTNKSDAKLVLNESLKKKTDFGDVIIGVKSENVLNDTKSYTKRKLVNILDDIKLSNTQTYELVSKMNLSDLQGVSAVQKLKITSFENKNSQPEMDNKEGAHAMEFEPVVEINITTATASNILVPPTPFLDISEKESLMSNNKIQNSQNEINNPQEKVEKFIENNSQEEKKIENTEKEMDVSATSDENFNAMRENILKKHNLDSSPQFVYSKKQNNSNCREEATSKFFKSDVKSTEENILSNNVKEVSEISKGTNNVEDMDIPEDKDNNLRKVGCSSPKMPEVAINQKTTVTGLLFNHGPDGIAESLDVSMSTTGYEDGDMDFPHCIDSSLLLSPKADIPETNENNMEILSQEVPNFLTGIKKTGLSFFGCASNSGSQGEPNAKTNDNNFNFTFGEEKKSRGGLFSMFR